MHHKITVAFLTAATAVVATLGINGTALAMVPPSSQPCSTSQPASKPCTTRPGGGAGGPTSSQPCPASQPASKPCTSKPGDNGPPEPPIRFPPGDWTLISVEINPLGDSGCGTVTFTYKRSEDGKRLAIVLEFCDGEWLGTVIF